MAEQVNTLLVSSHDHIMMGRRGGDKKWSGPTPRSGREKSAGISRWWRTPCGVRSPSPTQDPQLRVPAIGRKASLLQVKNQQRMGIRKTETSGVPNFLLKDSHMDLHRLTLSSSVSEAAWTAPEPYWSSMIATASYFSQWASYWDANSNQGSTLITGMCTQPTWGM